MPYVKKKRLEKKTLSHQVNHQLLKYKLNDDEEKKKKAVIWTNLHVSVKTTTVV